MHRAFAQSVAEIGRLRRRPRRPSSRSTIARSSLSPGPSASRGVVHVDPWLIALRHDGPRPLTADGEPSRLGNAVSPSPHGDRRRHVELPRRGITGEQPPGDIVLAVNRSLHSPTTKGAGGGNAV